MNQQNLQNIPIDIHANKLCDWLVSRHHCTKEWPEKIALLRQKVNAALKDMPENAVIGKVLVAANPLNYFHCLKIVTVLKETEADSKNIFGMYGSQRMKDWQEVIKLYQKDNLYMIEGASILARNVAYEIPALKRSVQKAEAGKEECRKKETSCRKQAQEFRDKFYHAACAQLGLKFEGFDPKKGEGKAPSVAAVGNQLVARMKTELPAIFESITVKTKELRKAADFYVKFLKSTIGLSEEQEKEVLGLLRLVIEKGNVTTYEFKNGEEPLKIEYPAVSFQFDEEPEVGDGDGEAGLDLDVGGIDFGELDLLAGNDVQLETGEIDWGGIDAGGDFNEGSDQIDFSIDSVETAGIVLEEDGLEGGLARGEDALSVLENPEIRNFFLDELVELEGFLFQRLEEMKNENPNDALLSLQRESMSGEEIGKFLTSTSKLLGMFNEPKTKQFLLVRESKRYILRIVDSLLQNLKLAKKMEYAAEEAVRKWTQLGEEIESVKPKIQSLTKQTRELQAELAKEISVKYNNRQVFISGGL